MNIILFDSAELHQALPRSDYRARHLTQILGAQKGKIYRAGVIGGRVGHMVIESITATEIGFLFTSSAESPPPLPLTLLIGHPRPLIVKRLVSDLSSIGVASVHFFIGENSEQSYLQSRIWMDGTLERMSMRGAEQAGVTTIPTLHRHRSLRRALQYIAERTDEQNDAQSDEPNDKRTDAPTSPSHSLYLTLPDAHSPRTIPYDIPSSTTTIAIGAERGWTDNEIRALQSDRYSPRTLGERILRTDTAALAVSVLFARCHADLAEESR